MNKVVLVGRLTRDPDVRYSQGDNSTAVARYSLAVDRKFKRDGEPTADFISCVAIGRAGEFAEKYFRQGLRVAISGRIQTGSYTNKDGVKVYTTDVFVEEQEFAESKSEYNANQQSKNQQNGNQQSKNQQNGNQQNGNQQNGNQQNGSFASPRSDYGDGFMNIPDGIDEELPFN